MAAQLRADLETGLFGHQSVWLTSTSLRTRMILKSRQIGATWYFARERLLVALETGKNQIFISASRAQANIFRNYIVQWVQKVCGIELKGDPMVIQRGADEDGTPIEAVTLYFLGTNYRTAQAIPAMSSSTNASGSTGSKNCSRSLRPSRPTSSSPARCSRRPARWPTRPTPCGPASASTSGGPSATGSRSTFRTTT
jgi:phage FluMu gp28-like protein